VFELLFIRKYLIPQKKTLSSSFISIVSIGVIALVVWLVLIFLSITEGMEKEWMHKTASLSGGIRITPTDTYYSSYYYLVDSISSSSQYQKKSLEEKRLTEHSDPYLTDRDEEIPASWPPPDRAKNGDLKDPVKLLWKILEKNRTALPNLELEEFHVSGGLLRLEMIRPQGAFLTKSCLTQVCSIASKPQNSPSFQALLLQPRKVESEHLKRFPLSKSPEETGIFLPKSFQDSGVFVGDKGSISYSSSTFTATQEQRFPIYVEGFYDPGIIAMGNRFILSPSFIPKAINESMGSFTIDPLLSQGVQVRFNNLNACKKIQHLIEEGLIQEGIEKYWKVVPFQEFEGIKDLWQQFQSDKYLFSLIGFIILAVASLNIISFLSLLVNDKRQEIGILLSLGTPRYRIATIFGGCGITLGTFSVLLGFVLAYFTMHHLNPIVHFLSWIQGRELLGEAFYGKNLPQTLSSQALIFTAVTTPCLALISGIIPAIKAARLSPLSALRRE
jgi:lipoprotein-releasing system permease protein